MTEQARIGLVQLVPVLASLAFGAVCALLILLSPVEALTITPLSEQSLGFFASLGNALYFVILVAIGAVLIYFLIRRHGSRLIMIISGFAMTAAAFLLSAFYLASALTLAWWDVPYADAIILVVSIAVTVTVDWIIFRGRSSHAAVVVLMIGGALGTFLGFSIPTASTVFILGFLSVYDTYTVYRGPVGKIARTGLDKLKGLSFSFREVQMGLGDLTFYSMLSGHMLLYFGYVSCLTAMVGIMIGCIISFRMLEKKGMFPGLPFPITLGLLGGFIAILV